MRDAHAQQQLDALRVAWRAAEAAAREWERVQYEAEELVWTEWRRLPGWGLRLCGRTHPSADYAARAFVARRRRESAERRASELAARIDELMDARLAEAEEERA